MLKIIFDAMNAVKDFRVKGRSKYSLKVILTIVIFAFCCGCDTFKSVAGYARDNFNDIQRLMPQLASSPSEDTIARVINGLNPDELRTFFTQVSTEILKRYLDRSRGRPKASLVPEIIALDGKTARGSIVPGKNASDIHIENAVQNIITLAARIIPDKEGEPFKKSNEIKAIPMVLDVLHLNGLLAGKVVTTDALGCQKAIAEQIIDSGAAYAFNLKNNQSILCHQAEEFFEKAVKMYPGRYDVAYFESAPEKVSGRIERRKCTVVKLDDHGHEWFDNAVKFKGCQSIFMVEKMVEYTNGAKEASCEKHYYLTSLTLPPDQLVAIAVKHWSVETMHAWLDNAYFEDKRKVWRGNAPEMMSLFRKLGLNFVVPVTKRSARTSVPEVFKTCYKHFDYLLHVLEEKPSKVMSPKEWAKHSHVAKTIPKSLIRLAA